VPSLQARILRPILRAVIRRDLKANSHSLDAYVAAVRRGFELGARRVPTARDIDIVPIDTGDVRGEWLIRRDVAVCDRAILYIHGGGMVACRPPQYRTLTFPLARRTGVPVFSLDYRLAPEHPYPAALDDALAAYAALRRRIPAAGIVLAGDSAGGNLALATLLALRERHGVARPVAGVIAISPWTDLLGTGASIVANEHTEDLIVRPTTPGVTNAFAYAPEALWRDPLVSPLYGDLRMRHRCSRSRARARCCSTIRARSSRATARRVVSRRSCKATTSRTTGPFLRCCRKRAKPIARWPISWPAFSGRKRPIWELPRGLRLPPGNGHEKVIATIRPRPRL